MMKRQRTVFWCVVALALGSGVSWSATPQELASALDENGLVWATGGDAEWVVEEDAAALGGSRAYSGAIGSSQESWLETTVEGPGRLSFSWTVSSEGCCDPIRLFVDGQQRLSIAGSVDWRFEEILIEEAGPHTLRWVYSKDGSVSSGADRAGLDAVGFGAGFPLVVDLDGAGSVMLDPEDGNYPAGEIVTLTATPDEETAFQGWTGAVRSLESQVSVTMDATQRVTAHFGTLFGPALNRSDWVWTSGGATPWILDDEDAWLGEVSARSGDIADGQTSWIESQVRGPGLLSFRWKVSSEGCCDPLVLTMNGDQVRAISGGVDWRFETVEVPAGIHDLRWTYRKDGSVSTGADGGWLDQVAFGSGYPIDVRIVGSGSVSWEPDRLHFQPNEVITLTAVPEEGVSFLGWDGAVSDSRPVVPALVDEPQRITAYFGEPLGVFVDRPDSIWIRGGAAAWGHDETDFVTGDQSIRSGDIGNSQSSWIETIAHGPGSVRFYWKVSSEGCCDPLEFFIDGARVDSIAGSRDWTEASFTLDEGPHRLRWNYRKDSSVSNGADAGWIDDVRVVSETTAFAVAPIPDRIGVLGDTVRLLAQGDVGDPLGFQWLKDGTPIAGATEALLVLDSLSYQDAGVYAVQVEGAGATVTSEGGELMVVREDQGRLVADSVLDYGGPEQGINGWRYGFYNRSLDGDGVYDYRSDFEELPNFDPPWRLDIGEGGFWTEIQARTMHPNGPVTTGGRVFEEHWAVRRWVSPIEGLVRLSLQVAKDNVAEAGDGVIATAWVDGESLFAADLASDDGEGARFDTILRVEQGTVFDFTVAPKENDGTDATIYSAQVALIEEGAPLEPVTIVQGPASQAVDAGGSINLSVTASGSAPLSYAWHKDGARLPDATEATLNLSEVTAGDAGQYWVRVSNPVNSMVSDVATVTVNTLPEPIPVTIVTSPMSQRVMEGEALTLSVVVTGDAPLTYDWHKDGARLPGASGATLELVDVTLEDAGLYWVRVSNAVNSALSETATVTVDSNPVVRPPHPADTNGDFVMTVAEVTAYGAAWKRGASWPTGPNPIPIGYVTRVGALWRGGERYMVDPEADAAPLWWINTNGSGGGDAGAEDTPSARPLGTVTAPAGLWLESAPSSAINLRDRVGEAFAFELTGQNSGSLWGTGLYTDDSTLARAAVHAGVLADGETGLVGIRIAGPQDDFVGSSANGISSASYGPWGGSYSIHRVGPDFNVRPVIDFDGHRGVFDVDGDGFAGARIDATGSWDPGGAIVSWLWTWDGGSASGADPYLGFPLGVRDITLTITDDQGGVVTQTFPWLVADEANFVDTGPQDASQVASEAGDVAGFPLTGVLQGSVWGTGRFTIDSTLGLAAIHAGVLDDGESAQVFLWNRGPHDSFMGSERNGWRSSNYNVAIGSYSFLAREGEAPRPDIVRTTPTAVTVGAPFAVVIAVEPPAATAAYAVEESVPVGLRVASIGPGGAFDDRQGKVKWGPFFDDAPRSLTYEVVADAGAVGPVSFVGVGSFDGVDQTIGGVSITVVEPAPVEPSGGSLARSVEAFGATARVTLELEPREGVLAYALEEALPLGLEVQDVNEGGVLDSVVHKIKWGPFFDDQSRTFVYTLVAPVGFSESVSLEGVASFDGVNVEATGAALVAFDSIQPPQPIEPARLLAPRYARPSISVGVGGMIAMRWPADSADAFSVEQAPTVLGPWGPYSGPGLTVDGGIARLEWTDLPASMGFFRVPLVDVAPPSFFDFQPPALAVGVDPLAPVSVAIADEGLVDLSRLRIGAPDGGVIDARDPRVSVDAGVITMTPTQDAPLGAPGETVTYLLSVSDIGGATIEDVPWTFTLSD